MSEYPPPPYHLGPLQGVNFLGSLPSNLLPTLVPEPLVVDPKALLWIYIFHIQATDPVALDYHEVGLFLPVTVDDKPGLYSLALFLDESLPITIGREVWGFPKRSADSITLDRNQDRCSGKLVHQGSALLGTSLLVSKKETRLADEKSTRVYTHRVIPSWQPDKPSINQIVALNWSSANEIRQEATESELRVSFPVASRLSVLNDIRCVKSWYSETENCTLAGGEVVRDFLANP